MGEKPTYQELEKRIQQLEQALQRGEDKYRILLDESSDPTFSFYPDGTYRYVNQAFAEGVGKSVDEIVGHRIWDVFPGEEGDKRFSVVKHVFATGKSETIEVRVPRSEGDQYYLTTAKAVKDHHGKVTSVICSSKNITDRKQTEVALHKSERFLKTIFNSIQDGISVLDSKLNIVRVNQAMRNWYAHMLPLEGKKCYEVYHGGSKPCNKCPTLRALDTGKLEMNEVPFIGEEGATGVMELFAFPMIDDSGASIGVVEYVRNVTDRKRTEAALRESEEKYRKLVEKSPLGIALIASEGHYKYINPQFSTIFGYTMEDIPNGKAWFKKAYPIKAYRQNVIGTWIDDLKQKSGKQARPRIFTVTCKDGSRKNIHFRSVTMENRDQFVIYEDVTEKSTLEQQLLQAQKFEAIGTLAGGIAHDFNNLLMGIQGRASLMSLDLDPSHPHLEHIQSIEACVRSAMSLTMQLLGFARGGKYEAKPININQLVLNSANMFSRTRKEIKIHTKIKPSPLVVEADQGQIEQVLLNMYVNAWQAMPDGGELYIETSAVVLDDNYCKPYKAKPGWYAKVSVTDTGIGMNEDTRRQIFDPFFTTKEKSRGTGLGLASAYGIIKNHGGIISVYSERNHGTTFNIYLQLSEKEIGQEIAKEGAMLKGSETILLIDDEDMIIDVGQAMLKKLGYRVVISKSGSEAIEKIKAFGNKIDLVIVDLIMPGMDGGKTFDCIREIHPQMPVVLSSGYAVNGQATEILQRGCNGFIQKPFNIAELSQKIRNIVEAAKDGNER
jgi:two-component system cell cycle sensor histidine kinase/response regulator CckA